MPPSVLVLSHLRFVVHVARGYQGLRTADGDLIQEGNIGLMKAVKRFDPSLGVRLVSFAVHWIRAEMHEFIPRNWRIVKVATTKAQRKLFFNLRKSKKRLGWMNHEEVQAVAKELGMPASAVLEMESRLSGRDVGFDARPMPTMMRRPRRWPTWWTRGDPTRPWPATTREAEPAGVLCEGLGLARCALARHHRPALAQGR